MKRPFRKVLAENLAGLALAMLAVGPAWAVSLSATGPAQPPPSPSLDADNPAAIPVAQVEMFAAGSAALVPLMAADMAANGNSSAEASAAAGGDTVGKPVDDVSFVVLATQNGRKEMLAARDALPQLKDPSLKKLAEVLANHHDDANARLSKIAEAKGWPVPGPKRHEPPPAGSAHPDFDAKWTAEMIAGHERSVALYRAQAQGGEDKELRQYARDTLPTIEQHLEWLRRLQK